MALLVYWYDFVCFGIVAASYIGSLWVLWRKEAANIRLEDSYVYESLLHALPDGETFVPATPPAHVGSNQLWTSCWKGVHPGWLLLTRFLSFLAMAGFLAWDLVDWGASTCVYYTEENLSSSGCRIVGLEACPIRGSEIMSSTGEQGLGYWVRWQVPICALIIATPSLFASNFIKKGKTDNSRVVFQLLWRPQWRNLSPLWLLCYRAFALLCLSRILFETLALDGAFAFYFYTQWTFALVIVYFAVGTVISAYGCWLCSTEPMSGNNTSNGFPTRDADEATVSATYSGQEVHGKIKLQSHYTEEAIRQRAGFWGYLMQTVYQTCAGAVVLTDIVFWCLIVPFLSDAHLGLNTLMGCMHTVNAVLLLVDTALNSLPFPWFRIAYFVQWSCIYVVFQWVVHACGFSWWPYPFLELDTPWAPLWYFLLAVVHIPCYGIYALIVRAKNSAFPRWFPHAFARTY